MVTLGIVAAFLAGLAIAEYYNRRIMRLINEERARMASRAPQNGRGWVRPRRREDMLYEDKDHSKMG